MNKQILINFGISTGSYTDFVNNIVESALSKKSSSVCIANVHMFVEAQKDEAFSKMLSEADFVTPDGKPLTWALKLLNGISQERVAGMDLLPSLLRAAEESNISVYFYGSTNRVMKRVLEKIEQDFSLLRVTGFYCPPFRQLTDKENQDILEKIKESDPNLVFVALGCPKQEKWMHEIKGKINSVTIGIGGALPVFAGLQKRAPQWMRSSGLEWLFRLIQEPRRLMLRYIVTNFVFLWIITKEIFRRKFNF